jgi:ATP-dependent protease ClpP protease subunit
MPCAAFCRENAERAIFLNEAIDQKTVNALTPQILLLRKKSVEPITVYIDSGGGYTKLAETLRHLLRAPDADDNACQIVTVVTGFAASAAADFLAAGGYAIAYPNATIHFHGTRHGKKEDLTMEVAAVTAKFLREYNDIHAIELAENTVNRSIFIYLNLRDSFPTLRTKRNRPEWSDVECFARALFAKLSPQAEMLPMRALKRYAQIQELANYVFSKVKPHPDDRLAKTERAIIRAIIEYEYRATKKDPSWSFTEENVDRIVEDFRLINDFYIGSHNESLRPLAKNFGPFFLNAEDGETLAKDAFESPEKRVDWLLTKTMPEIRPLWYFIVSICRLMQEKENPLTAEDAYWLGIVNEVVGSGLPCIRQIYENAPDEASPAQDASTTASSPPAAQ